MKKNSRSKHGRDDQRQHRRLPLPAPPRREHRAQQRGHEQVAVTHRDGPEDLALKLGQTRRWLRRNQRRVRGL